MGRSQRCPFDMDVSSGPGRPPETTTQVLPPREGLPNDAEAVAPGEVTMLPPPDEVARLEARREDLRARHERRQRAHAQPGPTPNTALLSILGLPHVSRRLRVAAA